MIQTGDTKHSIPQPEMDGELLKISGARLKNKRQFDFGLAVSLSPISLPISPSMTLCIWSSSRKTKSPFASLDEKGA
jgi:hypothetical protein